MKPMHGLFFTKAEGFVLTQNNLNDVDRQLFGQSGLGRIFGQLTVFGNEQPLDG